MMVSTIVAVAKNGVIGSNNTLIWKISSDLKHFKKITTGHHIIMGRKNYEDIGRALPDRTSIVITRQTDYSAPGCVIAHSLEEALVKAKESGETEAFIIGGAQIYEAGLPYSHKLYLTEVHKEYQGDVYFPSIGPEWKEIFRQGPFPATAIDECHYSFVEYLKER